MSLDTIYGDRIEQGIARWAANPGPEPEQSFSVTSFIGAGLKAVPQAALEVAGSLTDPLTGLEKAFDAMGSSPVAAAAAQGGMLPTPGLQRQADEARQREMRDTAARVPVGVQARRAAQEFAADPLTSHTADQVLNGLVRFGSKAVAAVSLGGPAIGAALLGLEEGNTVAQNLIAEGVDPATAAKVGAVQGGIAAAGVVLPLAGKTIPQTLALIGVGGPGSYVAQEALSRKILEEASYWDQASLHNPFDPLGLAISTIIPGGFGAVRGRSLYLRGKQVEAGTLPLEKLEPAELRALKYDDPRLDAAARAAAERHGVPPALLLAIKNAGEKSGPTATSPKGARGVMQFMPGTAKELGLTDPTDPIASLDAGARYLKRLFDAYGSWDAAVAHYNGGGTQAALVRSGGEPSYNETRGYLNRVREYVAKQTAQEGAQSPAVVDAARVRALNDTTARSLPDTPDAVAQVQRAADIVADSGGRAAEVEMPPVHPERVRIQDELAQIEAQRAELLPLAGELAERGAIRTAREELAQLQRQAPDDSDAAVKALAKDIQERDGVSYKTALSAAKKQTVDLVTDFEARVERLNEAVERNARAQQATQQVVELDRRQAALAKELERLPLNAPRAADAPPAQRAPDNALPAPESVTLAGDQPAKPVVLAERMEAAQDANGSAPRGTQAAGAPKAAGGEAGGAKDAPTSAKDETPEASSPAAALDTQLAQQLAADKPDLQVILPGTDTPISVREALARIAEEQKQDAQWADLVQVAATCALQGG